MGRQQYPDSVRKGRTPHPCLWLHTRRAMSRSPPTPAASLGSRFPHLCRGVYPWRRFPGSDVLVPLSPRTLLPPKGSAKATPCQQGALILTDPQSSPGLHIPKHRIGLNFHQTFLGKAWVCLAKGKPRPQTKCERNRGDFFSCADPGKAPSWAWPLKSDLKGCSL